MGHKTPLYEHHITCGGKIVDFGGWDMPLHYGSQVDEHHRVRQDAGMFDVSHMTIVDIKGPDAAPYLKHLLANNIDSISNTVGKALYSAMLNHDGGVIDDLIVYYMGDWFRTVVNCGTREKDLAWMVLQAQNFDVAVEERPDFAMIAVQGPNAIAKAQATFSQSQINATKDLSIFQGAESDRWFIARTGYTGEDGYEIILPAEEAGDYWQALIKADVAPCGLGARDTLRLEAGMNLYGNDMDDQVSPLAANMAWTIAWEPADRLFIGREALETQKAAADQGKLVGLILEGKGVLRPHQPIIINDETAGEITSGTFSPTLGVSIALARLSGEIGESAEVEIRKRRLPVRIVPPRFVRNGKSLVSE